MNQHLTFYVGGNYAEQRNHSVRSIFVPCAVAITTYNPNPPLPHHGSTSPSCVQPHAHTGEQRGRTDDAGPHRRRITLELGNRGPGGAASRVDSAGAGRAGGAPGGGVGGCGRQDARSHEPGEPEGSGGPPAYLSMT